MKVSIHKTSLFLVFSIFAVTVFLSGENYDISGKWEGTLSVSGTQLRIVFNVEKSADRQYISTMDSPDQGVMGIRVDNTSLNGDKVIFTINSISGGYEGTINRGGKLISGTWSQRGYTLPLNLKRVGVTKVVSTSKNDKKEPYIVRNVTFEDKSAHVTLAGTLTIPKKGGPFPAVVLVTGSGPQDRDETIFGHKPFSKIADYLTRRGIAVLRYDDRGVGKSTGDFSRATTADFAKDAMSAVNFLEKTKGINPRKIGIIGHSEGGLIAPMIAAKNKSIAFIVLMAGPGLPGSRIINMQSRLIGKVSGQNVKKIDMDIAVNDKIFKILETENDSAKAYVAIKSVLDSFVDQLSANELKQIGGKKVFIERQMTTIMSPWFRYFIKYDPKPVLEKVKCPVLAINGSKDLQVPAKENLAAIKSALEAGGNRNFKVKELKGLNHLFQRAKTGSPAEYAKIKESVDMVALKVMGDWILKIVK